MSIIKQALQLSLEDFQPDDGTEGESTSKKRKTKNAMKLIKTNRQGVWKELRRLQKQEQEKVQNKYEKPNFVSVVEKFQEDQVASKAKKVLRPEARKVKPGKNAQKVFDMHMKHFNRRNSKASREKEESTVFTDRDFDKFEEEYDFFK